MKYKLRQLLDVAKVQRLLDLFSGATGMVTALLDVEGNILTQSGWQTICTDFHRRNPDMQKRCCESDTIIAGDIKCGEKYTIYQCRNGLIDAAAPVMVQGEHVGNFFTGQFLFEAPDRELFKDQAQRFGLDEKSYLEALEKVPIIDREKLPPFIGYLAEFAELLGEMGLKQLQQIEAREKLNATLESITDGFCSVDQEWRFTYVNTAAERMLPKSRSELLGRCLWDEQVDPLFYEKCHQAVSENAHIGFEHYSSTLGMWLRTNLYPSKEGLSIYFQDITDQKEAEQELTESRALLKAIVEGTTDAVYAKDYSGKYILYNPAAEQLTGRKAQDVIGKDNTELFGNHYGHELIKGDRAVMAQKKTITFETNLISAEGKHMTFLATKGPLFDENGKVKGVFGVSKDITERKQAERKLKKAYESLEQMVEERTQELERRKEVLQTIVDTIPVMLHFRDAEGKTALLNREVERVLGWSREELKDINVMEECYPDPEYRAIVLDFMNHPGRGWRDLKVRNKEGSLLDNTWCNIRLSDGSQIGIGIDVTEHKRLEEQLTQSQKMEAIGTLAGGIAHDFNNILAAIVGNTELAMDEMQQEHPANLNLEQIMKASLRARDLVREIVTFSRKSEKEKKNIHLTPILDETFNLLRASLPPTIDMTFEISAQQDVVSGNASQLQQVLMNLATNAAQAMPDGGCLDIGLTDMVLAGDDLPNPDLKPVDYLVLTCCDTGCGIDPSIRSRIFDPFFTTKGVGSGTGLGLAVAYGIVKSHEGAIIFDSTPGKGSTFKVFIPKSCTEVKDVNQERQGTVEGTGHILFVDDEEPLRHLTKRMLSPLGYRVTTAPDAETALNLFQRDEKEYDVVITDQAMPGMSGLRLTEELLKIRADLPVILCTGYNELVRDEVVRSAGVRECLIKPLLKQELSAAIRRVRQTA